MYKLNAESQGRGGGGLFVLIGLLFAGYLGGCVSDPAQQSSKKFREGLEYASLNNKKAMIASFQEAVKLAPENEAYHLHLGMAYLLDGNLVNGENEFKQALEINRESKDAHRQLGRLYMRKGEWDRAVTHFQEDMKSPGTTPQPQRVYNWLALSFYNQGNFEEAERYWEKAIALKDNAAIRFNLALAYKDQARFDQALRSLQQAVALQLKFPRAHFEMSQLYIVSKKMDLAVEHFKTVIRQAPKSEWARLSRKYLNLIQQPK